jgi:O-antigen/teichoic acid export membrane protein
LGAAIFNFNYHTDGTLRALERFKQLAIITTLSHVARAGLIVGFAYMAILDVESAMILNVAQLVIAFAISSLIIPKQFYRARVSSRYPIKDVFTYSGWIYLFNILFVLFDRLDVFMLGYFRVTSEVGIYAVAFTLIKPFEMIPESFNTVFLPKVAKYTKKNQVFKYFKDSLKISSLAAMLGLVLIVFAKPMIIAFYTEEYLPSVTVFQILVGGFVLLTMIHPLVLVGHTIDKPKLFALMAAINLVLNFIGNIIFIPEYGAVGAAVVSLVSRVLGSSLSFLILLRYVRRWNERES